MRPLLLASAPLLAILVAGCAEGDKPFGTVVDGGFDVGADSSGADGGDTNLVLPEAGDDTGPSDTPLDPDASCASTSVEGKAEPLPVDIIWVVDNSSSMQPAVAAINTGLNDFAASISTKKLDYKVIMLALRSKTTPITVGGGTRYPVCIPPPLAGDSNCGNGTRFFQSHVDIKSTQPLEQFLGTLGQTKGYMVGETRGGDPWATELRPTATKTIVMVTDDESRLSASDFENFPGGVNPNNASLELPPGILHPSRKGQFAGYTFAALYGWGSETSPSTKCTYSDGSAPPSSGPTYTTLVTKTKGPRAKICDGAAAWKAFFDAIATAVVKTSKLACEIPLPTPTSGTLDPSKVNVRIPVDKTIPKVADATACGTGEGWYYDNELTPTKVILCPAACDAANAAVGVDKPGKIEILFGCKTLIK